MPFLSTLITALAATAYVVASPGSRRHGHEHFHSRIARAGGGDDAQYYNSTSNRTIVSEPEMRMMSASYKLRDSYTATNFFSTWSFFQGADPTHGYVNYVDSNTAWNEGLVSNAENQITMSVDSKNTATGPGRKSVRLTSNKAYNRGLFIADIAHMPGRLLFSD